MQLNNWKWRILQIYETNHFEIILKKVVHKTILAFLSNFETFLFYFSTFQKFQFEIELHKICEIQNFKKEK